MNKPLLSKPLARNSLGRVLFLAVLIMMSLTAGAEDKNFTTVELEKVYEMETLKNSYYQFTAPESGICTMYGSGSSVPRPFTSPACGDEDIYNCNFSYSSGSLTVDGESFGYVVTLDFNVEAGKTYYFKGWTADATKFVMSMENGSELTLMSVEPEQNSMFDITGNGQINLLFNTTASVEKAMLKCGDNEAFEVEGHPFAGYLTYEIRDTVYQMLLKGNIKGGEPMTLTLTGVCAASNPEIKYGGDGTLVLNYTCPSIPHMIESESIPEAFRSYWLPGDKSAVATLTFDGELAEGEKQTAVATISFGNVEGGDYYSENVPVTVNGKSLSIDFAGKLRTVEAMGVTMDYGTMMLNIANVRMSDGTLAYSPGQGTLGSYSYDIPYTEVMSDVVTEFTPAYGASLKDVDNIEIWISENGVITYTGASFTFTKDGKEQVVSLTADQITKKDDNGETTLTFAVPEEAKTGENVVVALMGVLSSDGVEREISAKYNIVAELVKDFSPASVKPADGVYVAELGIIDLTYDEEVFVNAGMESPVTVYNAADEAVATGKVEKVAGQRKVARVTLDKAVTVEDKYRVEIKDGVIGDKDYNATGFTTGRCNPAVTLNYILDAKIANAPVRTDPVDGSTVTELKNIRITYVNEKEIGPSYNPDFSIYLLNSEGIRVAEGSLELLDGGGVNYMNIALDKTITAPDTYTLQVEDSVLYTGTQYDAEPNEAISFTYVIEGEKTGTVTQDLVPVSVDPASETTVESLSEITLGFAANMVVNPYYDIEIFNRADRTIVGKGIVSVSEDDATKAVVKFDTPLTDAGTYTIMIPANTFGDAEYGTSGYMTGHSTAALSYYYEIKAAMGEIDVVTTPAVGSTVESLKDFKIEFKEFGDAAPSYNGEHGVLYNEAGEVVANTIDEDIDWDGPLNGCKFSLDKEITEAGTYKLVLPAGLFWLNDGTVESPEITLNYTVGGGTVAPIEETRKWDFTVWSDETKANLAAEAATVPTDPYPTDEETGWRTYEKNGGPTESEPDHGGAAYWYGKNITEPTELTANGEVIAETKGLQFNSLSGYNGSMAIAIDYPETALGTYAGGSYLWLNGKNYSFIIPSVKPGHKIAMEIESHKPADARGVKLTVNGTDVVIGEGVPTVKESFIWIVPADLEASAVDVLVTTTAGCHIYTIMVGEDATTGISGVNANAEVKNGNVYTISGTMVRKAGESLDGLAKGIYIIGGKKVVVR